MDFKKISKESFQKLPVFPEFKLWFEDIGYSKFILHVYSLLRKKVGGRKWHLICAYTKENVSSFEDSIDILNRHQAFCYKKLLGKRVFKTKDWVEDEFQGSEKESGFPEGALFTEALVRSLFFERLLP